MSRDGCLELARRLGLDADDVVEWWLERSSVREFDGGLPREEAEASALAEAREHFEAVIGPSDADVDADVDADALDAIDGIDVGGSGRIAALRMSTADEREGIAGGIVATDAEADAEVDAGDDVDADVDDGLGGDTILERPYRDEFVGDGYVVGAHVVGADDAVGVSDAVDTDDLRGDTIAAVASSADMRSARDELDGAIELADLAELRGAKRKGPRSAPAQLELPFATKRGNEHEH